MSIKNPFRIKSGLSVYALACGYIQQIDTEITGESIRVKLRMEHGAFHVQAHNFTEGGRIEWIVEGQIGDARAQWKALVNQLFGEVIRTIKKDKRYTVAREFSGDPCGALYVTRFCGEFVSRADTIPGAWVKAAEHNAERMKDYQK
ncbi:hypothetical protein EXT67_20525 [Pectobacterium atrosepticum]|uniref:Uncharacterized protein n=1 Tax=Pectobacterium phage phiTE TaxID=1116482 RepID=K9L540_9CAUD|nr:hypothetical protein [Pectobacterium atrosepticum]YP_007392551.1 hypothetical protein phiTE_089 [Pectobacterium phage phiTE]ARB11609.1 hypothetical protein CB7_135 [Pectobacterium phage vB_PatM_CB7]QQG33446.1 hypothetical protein [Pectobacterium phage PcCB7V]AEZ66255.1 hypothetical protein phiTE_089 [Pectobacterium phage phiTE]MCL6318692.1 hypothetical protein [Pectobacterium atrosepticum]